MSMIGKDEWYVVMSGYGTIWEPTVAILGRLDALAELVLDFPITEDEGRRLRAFHERAIAIGEDLLLVGHFDAKGRRVNDRRLVRVRGPLRGEV